LAQSVRSYEKLKKRPHTRTFKLRKNPQILTVIWRVFYQSPKKPNSGKRRVAKSKIRHVKRKDRLTARLIGYAYFPKKYFRLLVRGGRGNDTPGVTYSGIRGAFDFKPHHDKVYRRSFYGVKRKPESIKYVPKMLRRQGIKSVADIVRTRTL
jgi:small subunit ribosomal protein S12